MPTYRNVTNIRQTLNGKVIEPGQTYCSPIYFNENEVKLLKIDDAPYYNPLIYSEVITEQCVVKIPEFDNAGVRVSKYAIHFYLEKGMVVIHYNHIRNDPPLNLYTEAKWNVRCSDRTIDKIIVGADESFVLNIIIEKI
jgi:hypothetical protein